MKEDNPAAAASAVVEPSTDVLGFIDAAFVVWRVTERSARTDPGSRGDHCLIFECDDAARRVWKYPAGWRDLPPEALSLLSWRR